MNDDNEDGDDECSYERLKMVIMMMMMAMKNSRMNGSKEQARDESVE